MSLTDELRASCPGFRLDEPLSKHTSLAIGGPAQYYADVDTMAELMSLRKIALANQLPVFFLGAGSNLLVSDRGVRGLVLHLQGEFKRVEFNGTHVRVGAGVFMPTLARQVAERGLAGIEALIGIPGTIGGGLVMNAGTREGWLGNVVVSVDVIDDSLKVYTLSTEAAGFEYRHSKLEGKWVVGAELSLRSEESTAIVSRIDALLRYRTKTQPLTTLNCGSVFKNPKEGPAAMWIEKAGFKGTAIGGARVSEKHTNFIINEKNASAQNVRDLIMQIQKKVLELYKVTLEPEVKMAGDW